MVAVHHFDVYAGTGHAARDLPELTGLRLVQSLHQHFAHRAHRDSSRLKRPARGDSVSEQEMCHPTAVDDEGASALDAHAGASDRFAHFGERSRTIGQINGQVKHGVSPGPSWRNSKRRGSPRTDNSRFRDPVELQFRKCTGKMRIWTDLPEFCCSRGKFLNILSCSTSGKTGTDGEFGWMSSARC